jgi:hypothetical protein
MFTLLTMAGQQANTEKPTTKSELNQYLVHLKN